MVVIPFARNSFSQDFVVLHKILSAAQMHVHIGKAVDEILTPPIHDQRPFWHAYMLADRDDPITVREHPHSMNRRRARCVDERQVLEQNWRGLRQRARRQQAEEKDHLQMVAESSTEPMWPCMLRSRLLQRPCGPSEAQRRRTVLTLG
jgi:hypothetical protein